MMDMKTVHYDAIMPGYHIAGTEYGFQKKNGLEPPEFPGLQYLREKLFLQCTADRAPPGGRERGELRAGTDILVGVAFRRVIDAPANRAFVSLIHSYKSAIFLIKVSG